jgi:polysaccharide deacetylase family protein (PEP-CTERM system associated)
VERLEGGNWVPAEAQPPPLGSLEAGRLGGSGSEDQESNATFQCSGVPAMVEIPITTLRLMGRNFPIAGGGYFRLFPYPVTRWGLRRINKVDARPFVFYFHPWEIDPKQPRMSGAGLKSRFRHYLNLGRTEGRLRRLLEDFSFTSLRSLMSCLEPPSLRASQLPSWEAES